MLPFNILSLQNKQKVVYTSSDYMSDCSLKKCYVSLDAFILCRWCMQRVQWERQCIKELSSSGFGRQTLRHTEGCLSNFKWPQCANISLGQNNCLNARYPAIHWARFRCFNVSFATILHSGEGERWDAEKMVEDKNLSVTSLHTTLNPIRMLRCYVVPYFATARQK